MFTNINEPILKPIVLQTLVLLISLLSFQLNAQVSSIHAEGRIVFGDDTNNPEPGAIRFNQATKDFEGWNGVAWLSLTKNSIGSVMDIDGHVYRTVKIGNQEWMMENLRVSQYNDGSTLFNFQDSASWVALFANGAWCHYDNNPNFEAIYGKLYNGTAYRSGKLCPTGWKAAQDNDWLELIDYLGGSTVAGGRLKTTGNLADGSGLWTAPNAGGTNLSGFSGVPAGFRDSDAEFKAIGLQTIWRSGSCTSTGGNENCTSYTLFHNSLQSSQSSLSDNSGGSVRCVKDN